MAGPVDRGHLREQLIDIESALSSERNLVASLARILQQARTLTRADAGTLYLRDGEHLRFAVVQNDALSARLGDIEVNRLFGANVLGLDHSSVAGHVALSGTVLNISDAYALGPDAPCRFNAQMDEQTGYRTRSLLVIPLIDPAGDVPGVLELINALDDRSVITPFDPTYEDLVRSLASHAAAVLSNAWLLVVSERRRRSAEALAEIGAALSRSLDLAVVPPLIARSLESLLRVRSSLLLRLDPDTGDLAVVATSGADAPGLGTPAVVPGSTGVAGVAIRDRCPIATPDVLADDRFAHTPALDDRLAASPHRAIMAVPLLWQDRVIGALSVRDVTGRVFNAEDLWLARAFATQATVALENARLFDDQVRLLVETRRKHQEAVALEAVAREITSSLEPEDVFARIVERARDLCGCDLSFLARYDRHAGVAKIAAVAGAVTDALVSLEIERGRGSGGHVLETGEPFTTEDYLNDPRVPADYADVARQEGFVSQAVVPLRFRGETTGLLWVVNRRARPFTASHMSTLTHLANQAAIALENARLYRQAAERAEKLTALSRLTRLITSIQDSREVLHAVAREATTLLGGVWTRVWINDPAARVFRAHATFALDQRVEAVMSDFPVLPYGVGIVGRIVETHAPEYAPDLAEDPRLLDEALAQEGIARGFAAFPLLAGDRLVGALAMLFRDPRQLSSEEHELMGLLADQAAIAFENARLYEDEKLRAARLRVLARLEQIISSSLDTTEVLTAITNSAAELMNAPSVTFWVADETERILRLRAFSSAIGSDFPFQTTRFGDGVLGWIAVHRQPLHVPDASSDPRILAGDWLRAHGLTSFYGVPIMWQDSLMAVLALNGRAPFELAPDDQGLIDGFVAQAAGAMRNARLYEDLRVTHERLERSQAELLHSEKLSSLGQLIAGVAHELNNPLAVVLGSAYLIERQVHDPGPRKNIERIRIAAERATEIVRNLLQFARKTAPKREIVDLNTLAERVVDLIGNTLITHNVRLVRDLAPDLPGTVGEGGQLQQVVLNLVTNAIQAMEGSGGVLTVRTRHVGAAVRIEVGDTGPGVPEELRTRIFDPFFTTKPIGAGTGLGLSVAHGVVTAHGGRIWLDDGTTNGALMIVELPIGVGQPAEIRSARLTPGGRRILVVDDEPPMGHVLAELLRNLGHEVVIAHSAATARAALERDEFDLITVDLVMPGESGAELWRSLMDKAPHAAARVVFVTGAADPALQRFVDSTGRPLLTKPFTLAALSDVLSRELEDRAQ